MKDFKKLNVWQKGHLLTLDIYKITDELPKSELYGLTSQIRRAVSSIPTNIAEGCGRGSDKDFARFLQIAMGSASETEYLLILIHDLNFIELDDFNDSIDNVQEVKKMLVSLMRTLRG